jgi:hypothetical protein
MLVRVRTERAQALAAQERLSQTSHELRQLAIDSRMEIQAVLDETTTPTNKRGAIADFEKWINLQLPAQPDPAVRELLTRLEAEATQLADVSCRASVWRAKYLLVWDDLHAQRTMNKLRDLIAQMRSGIETFEGSRRLEAAIQYRRWRKAPVGEAAQIARSILLEQAQQQSYDTSDLKNQLAELGRLAERLAGEEQSDSLVLLC